jgi:hypothetical protein
VSKTPAPGIDPEITAAEVLAVMGIIYGRPFTKKGYTPKQKTWNALFQAAWLIVQWCHERD